MSPAAARTAAASRPPIARVVPAAALARRQNTRTVSASGAMLRWSGPISTGTPCPESHATPAAAATAETEPSAPACHQPRMTTTRIGVKMTVAAQTVVASADAKSARGRFALARLAYAAVSTTSVSAVRPRGGASTEPARLFENACEPSADRFDDAREPLADPFCDPGEPSTDPFREACEPSMGSFGDACEPSMGTVSRCTDPDLPGRRFGRRSTPPSLSQPGTWRTVPVHGFGMRGWQANDRSLGPAGRRQHMEGPGDFYATVDVVDVVDGDTFRAVIDGEKVRVRIMGINSPESGGFREEEDWGAESKVYAKKKLEGRTVHLFTDPGDPAYDQYDRLLVHVVMENGMNYAVLAVAEGMAHTYILGHQELTIGDTLRKAEKLAKAERRGMWASKTRD